MCVEFDLHTWPSGKCANHCITAAPCVYSLTSTQTSSWHIDVGCPAAFLPPLLPTKSHFLLLHLWAGLSQKPYRLDWHTLVQLLPCFGLNPRLLYQHVLFASHYTTIAASIKKPFVTLCTHNSLTAVLEAIQRRLHSPVTVQNEDSLLIICCKPNIFEYAIIKTIHL